MLRGTHPNVMWRNTLLCRLSMVPLLWSQSPLYNRPIDVELAQSPDRPFLIVNWRSYQTTDEPSYQSCRRESASYVSCARNHTFTPCLWVLGNRSSTLSGHCASCKGSYAHDFKWHFKSHSRTKSKNLWQHFIRCFITFTLKRNHSLICMNHWPRFWSVIKSVISSMSTIFN